MSRQSCCSPGPVRSRPARRRFFEFGGWLAPTVMLALLPKCPACLAAYVALGTGVALSGAAATQLRTSIVAFCFAGFAILAVRGVRRFWLLPR